MVNENNIVVFSDKPKVLEEISSILASSGFGVKKIKSVNSLWSFLKKDTPDIIIIDSDSALSAKLKSDKNINSVIIFLLHSDKKIKKNEITKSKADFFIEFPCTPVVLVTNITSYLNKKKKETKLKENEMGSGYFNGILKQGHWKLDIKNNKFICSSEACNILGILSKNKDNNETTITVDELFSLIHPDDRYKFHQKLDAALTGAIPLEIAYRTLKRNKEIRHLYVYGKTEIDKKGKIGKLIGVIQDITEQKQMEQAFIENQARLSKIINSAMDAVITVNQNQIIVLFNIAAEKMFGCKATDAIGKSIDKFIPEKYRTVHKKHIDNFGKTGITMRSMGSITPISGLRSNGEEFPIEASISQTEAGGQKLYTVIIRDITEKKRAEDALITSEARYRILFKKNPLPMWVFDTETLKFLAVNFVAIRSYGYSRDEFLSMTIKDIRPPEDVDRLINYVTGFKPSLKSAGLWRHIKKDGTIINVEIVSHEIEFSGRPARLVLALDVTEKIQAEEALKESDAFQKALIESSPLSIFSLDVNGNVMTWNLAAEKVFGWKYEEVVGKFNPIVPTDSEEEFNSLLKFVLAGNNLSGKELLRQNKNGKPIYISLSAAPIYRTNDKIIGVIATIEDITERKKYEEELRKLSRAVEQSPVSIIITDTQGKIEYVNPKFCEVTGYAFDEVLGRNPNLLKSGETSSEIYEELWETIKEGKEWTGEFHNKKKSGELFWEYASISPVKNSEGVITNFLAVKEDITERKKYEEELRFSREQLRALTAHIQSVNENEREVIAREIHDELGQVLTSVKMNLAFINKNIIADNNSINVHELKNEINGMTSVIDSSIKRIRKIITQLRPEVLDNLGLIPAIEWQIKEFETKSGISSRFENLCGEIEINKDVSLAVYRIFQEALTNITRHAKASEINVKIERKDNHFVMEISDNGVGFDLEKSRKKRSFGVLGMNERVKILRGSFNIEKLSPYGTKVSINVPL